jgi:hypothetical protein
LVCGSPQAGKEAVVKLGVAPAVVVVAIGVESGTVVVVGVTVEVTEPAKVGVFATGALVLPGVVLAVLAGVLAVVPAVSGVMTDAVASVLPLPPQPVRAADAAALSKQHNSDLYCAENSVENGIVKTCVAAISKQER